MTKRKIGAVCGIALLIAAIQKGLTLLPSWGGYKATGSDMITTANCHSSGSL